MREGGGRLCGGRCWNGDVTGMQRELEQHLKGARPEDNLCGYYQELCLALRSRSHGIAFGRRWKQSCGLETAGRGRRGVLVSKPEFWNSAGVWGRVLEVAGSVLASIGIIIEKAGLVWNP